MPAERLSMRQVKEILRLKANGLSNRQIGKSMQMSPGSVCRYLQRATASGLNWPLPEGMSDKWLRVSVF